MSGLLLITLGGCTIILNDSRASIQGGSYTRTTVIDAVDAKRTDARPDTDVSVSGLPGRRAP